jgi:predicted homoserine dehydrogenase-like protein
VENTNAMHALYDRAQTASPIRAALIGAGHFGTVVVAQARTLPWLELAVVADRDLEAARRACQQAGYAAAEVACCATRAALLAALERRQLAITDDALLLNDLPLEVIVESTGVPEAGARHAAAAIAHGQHVVMISKEPDSVVGPILKHRADQAGAVYTQTDGDQHGLLIGLVAWARLLSLEVLCGGKARDTEFVYDVATGQAACGRQTTAIPAADRWALACQPGTADPAGYLATRQVALALLPQAAGFDLCELAIAANATGLLPDQPALHHPALYTRELPAVLAPHDAGGILGRQGAIEVVTCLRAPHEAGLGGGVFIVVGCANDYARMILTTKGLLANASASAALIYRPYHLCGVETAFSLLSAGLLHQPTGGTTLLPRVDLVATAARDLPAGTVVGNDHSPEFAFALVPAWPRAADAPLPFHLAQGNRLAHALRAGDALTWDAIVPPAASVLWGLRAEQDTCFAAMMGKDDVV